MVILYFKNVNHMAVQLQYVHIDRRSVLRGERDLAQKIRQIMLFPAKWFVFHTMNEAGSVLDPVYDVAVSELATSVGQAQNIVNQLS